MIKRLFPHPLLSITLTFVWLALVNKFTLGNLLLGGALGIIVPAGTNQYWPGRSIVSSPLKVAMYFALVLWDIVVANFQVAAIILFKRDKDIHSKWVCVPLELTSPEGITVLAGTITMTPGTISAMLSADNGSILVHCLHSDDPQAIRDDIKHRYERRLMEIFQ